MEDDVVTFAVDLTRRVALTSLLGLTFVLNRAQRVLLEGIALLLEEHEDAPATAHTPPALVLVRGKRR